MRIIEGKARLKSWPFLVLGICFVLLAAGFVFAPIALGSALIGTMFGIFLMLSGAGMLSLRSPLAVVLGIVLLVLGVIAVVNPTTGLAVVSFAGGVLVALGIVMLVAGFGLLRYLPVVAPVPGAIALVAGILVLIFPQLGVFLFSAVCALLCVAVAVALFSLWQRLRHLPPADVTIVRD